MGALAFEAAPNVRDASGYYAAPNEDVVIWRHFLKGKRIERAAGICSSGEVGLFAMLPTVRRELVLVDHSRRSLSIAMLKYLLIRELGAKQAHALLTCNKFSEVAKALGEVKAGLPDPIRQTYERMESGYDYSSNPFKGSHYHRTAEGVPNASIKTHWNQIPMRLIERSGTKLGKVSFIHGDMKALAERKHKFDALYLSNALEHYYGATVVRKAITKLSEVLNPGAWVLIAIARRDDYKIRERLTEAKWEVVEDVAATKASIHWQQVLCRVPA